VEKCSDHLSREEALSDGARGATVLARARFGKGPLFGRHTVLGRGPALAGPFLRQESAASAAEV